MCESAATLSARGVLFDRSRGRGASRTCRPPRKCWLVSDSTGTASGTAPLGLIALRGAGVWLRREAQVGLLRDEPRKALPGVLVRHGRDDDDVLALLPVGRRRHRVLRGELQRVDHAEQFREIASRAGWVGERELHLVVRADDEYRSHRRGFARVRVDHVVHRRDGPIRIGDQREVSARSPPRPFQRWWSVSGSTLKPMIFVSLLDCGFKAAAAPSSVVHTGVKSRVREQCPPSRFPSRHGTTPSLGGLGRKSGTSSPSQWP